MKAASLCLCLVVGCASLGAQSPVSPPPDDSRSPIRPASRAGEYHVIVEGCVQGNRLKPLEGVTDLAGEYLSASEWILEGPREIVQQIRSAYDRHHLEVTGIAVLPQSLEPRHTDVDSHRLPDGTRITAGAQRTSPERPTTVPHASPRPVRVDVKSVKVLAERCA